MRKSVTEEGFISFLDGRTYKTLVRRLSMQGYTPGRYRERFGLPSACGSKVSFPAASIRRFPTLFRHSPQKQVKDDRPCHTRRQPEQGGFEQGTAKVSFGRWDLRIGKSLSAQFVIYSECTGQN